MKEIIGMPITRDQANAGIDQLQDAMIDNGLDPEKSMAALIKSKAFANLIPEFFLSAFESGPRGCIIFPTGKQYTVADYVKLMLKENGGKFDFVDSEIFVKFGQITFSGNEGTDGEVQILKQAMTQNKIIAEGKKLAIYKGYDIGEALMLSDNLASWDMVQKMNKTVLIFLKEKYVFHIKHAADRTWLYLRSVKFHNAEFNPGDGVLFGY